MASVGWSQWQPTATEVARYHELRDGGASRAELAAAFGVSTATLDDCKRAGRFGPVESRQGSGGGARVHRLERDDSADRIMGIDRPEIERRCREIQSGWSDEEKYWRGRSVLPGETRRLPKSHERFGRAASPTSGRRHPGR
jgi:hypothetical protein